MGLFTLIAYLLVSAHHTRKSVLLLHTNFHRVSLVALETSFFIFSSFLSVSGFRNLLDFISLPPSPVVQLISPLPSFPTPLFPTRLSFEHFYYKPPSLLWNLAVNLIGSESPSHILNAGKVLIFWTSPLLPPRHTSPRYC